MENSYNVDRYNDIAAASNLVSEEEYKNTVYQISKFAADMVVKTLGPFGSTTIIDDPTFTYPSKDGWSCLNRLHFNDPIYDSIYKTIKQISFSIVNKVGDGTTSALIGANAFLNEILEYQKYNDFRQVDFLNNLNKIKDQIIDRLENSDELHLVDKDGDFSDIRRIAYVSSNSNDALSDIIQKIYQETNNPNIFVTFDPGPELTYEVQTGYRFECSVLNHKVYINEDNGRCKMSNGDALIAIFNHNVTYNEHGELISMLSNYANAIGKTIIIAAPYFDDVISSQLGSIINQMIQKRQVPSIMMMQIPMSMEIHHKYLSDLNMLTNAQVFDAGAVKACYAMMHNQQHPDDLVELELLQIPGYNYESPADLIAAYLGQINTITIDSSYAILQDYEDIVNPTVFNSTMEEIRREYEFQKEKANKSDSNLSKEFMDVNQRYTKLKGKMGIIKVGGASEIEKHCTKDSVDDAVLACRSAYDHGYIRGLNLAMIKTIHDMSDSVNNGQEQDIRYMLENVFLTMTNAVMCNKYDNDTKRRVSFAVNDTGYGSMNFCNEEIVDFCIENNYGYNLVTETFDTMDDLTVINSVSTDIEILKIIIGILSLMLTSNQFLSTSRTYDRKMTRTQVLNQKIEDNQKMAAAVASAVTESVMQSLRENNAFTQVSKIFKR